MATLSLRFIYTFCNDLAAMRHFYSELLQLQETYYAPGVDGGLAYRCDALQFTIFPAPEPLAVPAAWQMQPGWEGGERPGTSWSIVAESQAAFATAVDRLVAAKVPIFFPEPQWVGYWSFPVKDPMGNTVEVTFPSEEEPPAANWSDVWHSEGGNRHAQ